MNNKACFIFYFGIVVTVSLSYFAVHVNSLI